MTRPPYGVRLFLGVAATVIEETRKLPQTVLTYPMTAASQAVQSFMRVQQTMTQLAVKGDEAWDSIFPPTAEQPEWATFDEDLDTPEPDHTRADAVYEDAAHTARATQGRFALYSSEPAATKSTDRPAAAKTVQPNNPNAAAPTDGDIPTIVIELQYPELTLAQLRARLASLTLDELETLLAYEEGHKARAPYQTLLANRITRTASRG